MILAISFARQGVYQDQTLLEIMDTSLLSKKYQTIIKKSFKDEKYIVSLDMNDSKKIADLKKAIIKASYPLSIDGLLEIQLIDTDRWYADSW